MSGASESGATAVTRTKDGIPCWSGEAATCVQYEEASLLWEQSLTWEKRYTAGPKLVQELTGAARRFVAGQSAGWVAYRGGVRVLMDHLRRALGKPRVNEVTDLLATYFKGTRRKANESMNEYITRKTEAYMRASQALKRVQPHYERDDQGRPGGTWTSSRRSSYEAPTSWSRQWTPANEEPAAAAGEAEASTEATDTPAGERDQWSGQWSTWGPTSWSSYSWQWRGSWGYPGDWGDRSSSGGSVLGETSTGLPELLPAFIQGWYLLADSNLDHAEKNIVLTALGGDFTPQKVAQELRNQFPEGEVRRRDQRRYQSYIGEAAEVSEDEEGDAMGFSLQELTEGGMTEEGIAMVVDCEETAREALAALHQAKRTLKEARQKQHFVKQSRRYYQGGSSSTSSTAPRARDDSNIDCLRCGKRGHRAANCPMKPLAAQAEATTDGDDNGRQQAPFVCYSDTAPGTTDFSETYNMHDISDSLFDNAACLAGFAQSQESEAAWSVTAAGTGLTTSGAVAAGMCVVDGGATQTVGSVAAVEAILNQNKKKHGSSRLTSVSTSNPPTFSFGNSTENKCLSTASLQVSAGGAPGELRVHTLDHGQSPVLLSVEALRSLGAVIDFQADLAVFRHLDASRVIPLGRGRSGHQLLPLTEDWMANAYQASQAVPSLREFLPC